jgi:hypothetical protein
VAQGKRHRKANMTPIGAMLPTKNDNYLIG